MSRHFEILKRPELIVPEAALRRRHIDYSGSKPPACTFKGANHISDAGNTHTHTFAFGPEDPKRLLAAAIAYGNNSLHALSGVTIGGIAATRVAKHLYNQGGGATITPSSEIWVATVPTGTSGSVVLPINNGDAWDSGVALYAVTGILSTTPTATAGGDDVSHPGTLNMSISVEAGGLVIAAMYFCGTGTVTGASVSGVPKAFFDSMGLNDGGQTGGSTTSKTATTISTTTTFSGGGILEITGCIAAFR